jgi:hypothetical protein
MDSRRDYFRVRSYLVERYDQVAQWYALLACLILIPLPWASYEFRMTWVQWKVLGSFLYLILVCFIIIAVWMIENIIVLSLAEHRIARKYAQFINIFKKKFRGN